MNTNIPYLGGGKKRKKGGFLKTAVVLGALALIITIIVSVGMSAWNNKAVPFIGSTTGATFLETPEAQAKMAEEAGVTDDEIKSCNGVSAINLLYNDFNFYVAGTDPGTNLTTYDPISKSVADDATSSTVPVQSTIKALLGNYNGVHDTTYFGEEVEFNTGCVDLDLQKPKLYEASAPTITWVNDNGVTLNSDTDDEVVVTEGSYSPCVTVKAPSNDCASRHGAVLSMNYDATYVNTIDTSDLVSWDGSVRETKLACDNCTSDNTFDFLFEGELCDGDKTEICFDISVSTGTPLEGNANVILNWLPLNKDLDTDNLASVLTGLYDDKNVAIFLGNTSKEYHTADV